MLQNPFKATLLTSSGPAPTAPEGWKSPMREKDGSKKGLYQCVVETREGLLRVGPAMLENETRQFGHALGLAIRVGKVTGWGTPTVVRIN